MSLLTNLISYWSMDEASGTRTDSHGSNDLTDNNTVGSATGKINNAADFESNNNEHLSHADNADLSPTGDCTLACWVKLETKPSISTIMGKWPGTGDSRALILRYQSSDDRFAFFVNSDGTSGGTTSVSADNLGSPSTGTWYFIVAWHDDTNNTINIQVNDGTVDSTAHTVGIHDSDEPWVVGARSDGGVQEYDGLIDEFGYWKRVLTSQERTDLYNSGDGLAYSEFAAGATIPAFGHDALGTAAFGGLGVR